MIDQQRAVTKDIGHFQYATTIGCAQFREHVVNRMDYREDDDDLIHSKKGGRIPVVSTNIKR